MRRTQTIFLTLTFALALTTDRAAEAGSVYFDGMDDSIVVSEAMQSNGAMTLEAWVDVESATSGGRIMSNRSGANGYEFLIYDPVSADPELWFTANGNLEIQAAFPRNRFNTWMHVAFAYQGPIDGTMKLFIDGVEVASSVRNTTILSTEGPFRIGEMGLGTGFAFHGGIDEPRVWNSALTQGTISAWKDQVVTSEHPDYASLMGYWRFEEGAGQVAVSSVNSPAVDGILGLNSGVDVKDPVWSESTPVPVNEVTFGSIKARIGLRSR